MVQIIQPVPSAKTVRQQAFQEGLDQIGSGIVSGLGAMAKDQETKRQLALGLIANKQKEGLVLNPQEQALLDQTMQDGMPQQGGILSRLFSSNEEQAQAPMAQVAVPMAASKETDLSMYTPAKQREIIAQRNREKLIEKQLEELEKPFSETKEAQRMRFAEGIAARKAEREAEIKKSKYKIPDFELADPEYTPTAQDLESIKKANKVSKDMANIVNSLAKNVKEYGISSGTGATKGGQAVERDISNLVIAVKEAANLGALSGPDMGLAEAAIGRLRGGFDMLNPFNSREDAVAGLADIIKKANDKVETEATARGFTRKGKAPEFVNPYIEKIGEAPKDLKSQVKKMSDEELMAIIEGK